MGSGTQALLISLLLSTHGFSLWSEMATVVPASTSLFQAVGKEIAWPETDRPIKFTAHFRLDKTWSCGLSQWPGKLGK